MKNVCRICLSKHDNMVSLLSPKENKLLLLDMFTSVTSIKVHLEDGLPLQICDLCETEVVNCYQFKIRCKNSNSVLKALIKKELKEGISTKIFLKETKSSVMEEQTYVDGGHVTCKKMSKRNKQANKETEAEHDNIEEIEYLEDGIFESTEAQTLKEHIDNSLNKQEKVRAFENPTTGVTEKRKQVQTNSSKGKRKYYTCTFCSKKFLKLKTLKMHVKQIHGKARYPHPCNQCNDSFSCEQDLHIHSALHTKGNPWICNQCHKEFKERGKMRRHVRRHMEGNRHECDLCGKQFAEQYALRRHTRVHTGQAPEKRHACHICDKKYSESAALAAHVLRHEGLRPCACDTCGKTFPSPRLLASHRRVHSDRKPYACRYCDKRFRHVSTRNTHHRTHTGEKPYVCSTCGKSFIQNSNLTLHMRTHTGEKPYSCDLCERKFSSGSALASHRRTHSGEKPYRCPVCEKRFSRVYLNSHIRQHSGERPFSCCVCNKRFPNSTRLRQHHFIHTGERPFECAICSQKFKTKGYLAKHLKNHEMIKKLEKENVLILEEVEQFRSCIVKDDDEMTLNDDSTTSTTAERTELIKENITVEVTDVPLEVTGELILPSDRDLKTELLVINREVHGNVCLRSNGGNKGNSSLQVHLSGSQVTTSKISINN